MFTQTFYEYFNNAYRSYLNNDPHSVTLDTFLSQISDATNSIGYIAFFHENYFRIISCYAKETYAADPMIYISNESICKSSLVLGTPVMTNIITQFEPLYDMLKNAVTYICIPCVFNGICLGFIGLGSKLNYPNNIVSNFKLLGSLTGTLLNNIKMSTQVFMTCDLSIEILNLTDSIIVTNNALDILYINGKAITLLDKFYASLFPDGYINNNLIKVFPQLAILHDEQSGNKIYKNREIDISISDTTVENIIHFVINTIDCKNKIYNVINLTETIIAKQINANTYLMTYLSHELRNSLQSVILANYMIKMEIKKPMKHTKIIERACQNMKRIVNDILDLSKIETNELVIEISACNINDIVLETIDEYKVLAATNDIEIILNINESVPKMLQTDQMRLTQILANLISNAIKYAKGKNVIIDITHDASDQKIIFSITDTGMGIKKDELCHIFKHFGQTSNSSKNGIESTGLGLYISQKLAHMLGGSITVKSEYNVGSTFSLIHPIGLTQSINATQKNDQIYDYTFSGKILLVDDEWTNTGLLKLLIQNFNYEFYGIATTETVDNGFDAIEMCKINAYDVIFMDISMGGIDGISTTKSIRNNGYKGIIIAITGNVSIFDDKSNCLLFDDTIIKPYDSTILLKTLKKHLVKEK